MYEMCLEYFVILDNEEAIRDHLAHVKNTLELTGSLLLVKEGKI